MDKYVTFLILLFVSSGISAQSQDAFHSRDAKPLGGWGDVRELFRHEMVYPEAELENKAEGVVFVKLNILENGETEGHHIIQSVNQNIDNEALRIVRKIQWLPAIAFEEPVRSSQIVEVEFNVNRYQKWVRKRGYHRIKYPYEPVDMSHLLFDASVTSTPPYVMFPDSNLNIQKYIYKNLVYPEDAFRRNISGKVRLQFTVEQSGYVSNVHPVIPIGGGCTEEAIRLIKSVKWHPALNDGMSVRSWMTIDVIFVLPVQAGRD